MSHVVFRWCQRSAPDVGNLPLSTITRKDGATGTLLILALLSKSWNLTCPLWFTEESPLYLGPLRNASIAGLHIWFLQQWQLETMKPFPHCPSARMSGALTHLSCVCQKSQRMAWKSGNHILIIPLFVCKSRYLTLPFMHSPFPLLCWEKKSSSISSFQSPKRVILSSANRVDTWKVCGCPWFQTRWARVFGYEGFWALGGSSKILMPEGFTFPFCSHCFPFTESKCSQEPYFHSFQWSPWARTPKPFPCHGGHQSSSPPGG